MIPLIVQIPEITRVDDFIRWNTECYFFAYFQHRRFILCPPPVRPAKAGYVFCEHDAGKHSHHQQGNNNDTYDSFFHHFLPHFSAFVFFEQNRQYFKTRIITPIIMLFFFLYVKHFRKYNSYIVEKEEV